MLERVNVCVRYTAETEDETTLGSRVTIEAERFKKIKKRVLRRFADRMTSRIRDWPTFENRPFRITEMVVTEYVKKRTWKEPIEENYYS